MEITWLGHSCFRLKGRTASVVTDPYDASVGYPLSNPSAEVATISLDSPAHNYAQGVRDARRVIRRPGEYEIGGVSIQGLVFPPPAPKDENVPLPRNVLYLIEMDDLHLCHLGALAHVPSEKEAAELGTVHILLTPVGGHGALDAARAAEVVRLIEPNVVIPMRYKTRGTKVPLDPLDGFLKEMGVQSPTSLPKFTVTLSSLPSEMQVVVLDPATK